MVDEEVVKRAAEVFAVHSGGIIASMRAALAAVLPAVRRAERERCANVVEQKSVEVGRQECCGHGVGYGEQQECCGDPNWLLSDTEAAAAIRAMEDES